MERCLYSLDFGRGNMSAFYGEVDVAVPQYKPLMAEGGEPSGFARLKDGSIALGRRLYAVNAEKVESYHINFKAIPDERNRGIMVEFARAWREELLKRNPGAFSDKEEYWFIGIPTGWRSTEIVDAYRGIFEEAGYPNVVIVPESNAAMYNAQRSYGAVARADSQIGVLCLDLGAYSNDATYVLPGRVDSCGGFTGAALIEQMMLRLNLQMKYSRSKKVHNIPELLETVRRKYDGDPKFRRYLVMQMRRLKERYYDDLADGKSYSKRDLSLNVELDEADPDFAAFVEDGEEFFVLYVNDELASAVAEGLSVRQILGEEFSDLPEETQQELGDKTWSGCLRDFLLKSLEKCPALAEAGRKEDGSEKPIVLLTGGAAKMSFVEEIIYGVLPNIELYKDEAPMDTIARGLWLFGPDKLRAMEFDSAFETVLSERDEDGDLVLNVILSRAHDKLGVGVIDKMASMPINCVVQAVKGWRDYQYDSDRIVSSASEAFKKYFRDEMPAVVQQDAREAKQYIAEEVNKRFSELLESSRAGRSDLFEADELDIEYVDDFIKGILLSKEIINALNEQILKEKEVYDGFPNPGWLNILSRRADLLNEVASQLDERNRNWYEFVFTHLKQNYDAPDSYGPFAQECLYELLQALNRKKRELLGALIIEESFDDEE